MSGIEAGIPLWDGLGPHHSGGGRDYFGVMHYRDVPHAEDRRDPTHRAYPVEYDAAREAVVAAARALDAAQEAWISTYNEFGEESEESGTAAIAHADAVIDLKDALDALAAAGSES